MKLRCQRHKKIAGCTELSYLFRAKTWALCFAELLSRNNSISRFIHLSRKKSNTYSSSGRTNRYALRPPYSVPSKQTPNLLYEDLSPTFPWAISPTPLIFYFARPKLPFFSTLNAPFRAPLTIEYTSFVFFAGKSRPVFSSGLTGCLTSP